MNTNKMITLCGAVLLLSCTPSGNSGSELGTVYGGTNDVVVLNVRQKEALDLRLGTFQMRNLTTVVKTNGELVVPPANSAEVTSMIGGHVKSIHVFHGDWVNKGQVLAILEHPDYISIQEGFSEVAHKLDFLEKEYERQKELFENNVGAGKDFQEAQAEYNTAKAKFQGLKSRLELLNLSPEKVKMGNITNEVRVLSPLSGYLDEVPIKLGTYVEPRDILFRITDSRELHADFLVYENDVHLLKEGQKIHLLVSNRPGEELLATIFAIGKEFEANTRAVHIHARLEGDPGNLVPGMFISGHIHTDETYTRTLPDDAVASEGIRSYIFILDEKMSREISQQRQEKDSTGTLPVFALRRIQVVPGKQDEGFTEIKLLDSLPGSTSVALNSAYYLLAELSKEESGHAH